MADHKLEPPRRTAEQYEADKAAGINAPPGLRAEAAPPTCPKRRCPYVAGYNCIEPKCAAKGAPT